MIIPCPSLMFASQLFVFILLRLRCVIVCVMCDTTQFCIHALEPLNIRTNFSFFLRENI